MSAACGEIAVSDLGENPTLRDAIAGAVKRSIKDDADSLEYVAVAVEAWIAARELVVPSPQPDDAIALCISRAWPDCGVAGCGFPCSKPGRAVSSLTPNETDQTP